MPPMDLSQLSWRLQHSATDDAYLAWFNAHRQTGELLRAWREASGSSARAAAYESYCSALDQEEQAAGTLERLFKRRLAA
jgi:hypothetical protein